MENLQGHFEKASRWCGNQQSTAFRQGLAIKLQTYILIEVKQNPAVTADFAHTLTILLTAISSHIYSKQKQPVNVKCQVFTLEKCQNRFTFSQTDRFSID